MGLRARQIKTNIEVFATECEQKLNKMLGTNFAFEIDWKCLPEDIDGWNWEDKDLAQCFYNSFFKPLENSFGVFFKDKMYQSAIKDQIKTIKFGPGRSMAADFDYKDGAFFVLHTLGANQKENINDFLKSCHLGIEKTVNSKLN